MNPQSLSLLKPSEKAIVIGFSEEDIPAKILEMGIVPGVSISLIRKAPWNGPLYIEYGNEKSIIMLRKEEAKCILIEVKS
ncbi:ferrous iron transport protein A [Apibacter muscae]|uniref:Ferrous iron transport protein A n=1 Tax=Apibacter muscae TaxID=2509004 RepID=A0A563DDB0_9FLAO|nr:FeoA family protein [Apibacter muscae]TWP24038.1 ferrous iron transport protein A [Apibacter muscae]TWP27764.1 ferrous iron transport protein A [Apibacter muscae]TWP29585.1 ferrous iron transport protein A [Apibacter muscae]